MTKKNKGERSIDVNDDLAARAHELVDDLAQQHPHLEDAARTTPAANSKLKPLEDKLIDTFTEGLRRAWEGKE